MVHNFTNKFDRATYLVMSMNEWIEWIIIQSFIIINEELNRAILGLRKHTERFGRRKERPWDFFLVFLVCPKRAEGNGNICPLASRWSKTGSFCFVSLAQSLSFPVWAFGLALSTNSTSLALLSFGSQSTGCIFYPFQLIILISSQWVP